MYVLELSQEYVSTLSAFQGAQSMVMPDGPIEEYHGYKMPFTRDFIHN